MNSGKHSRLRPSLWALLIAVYLALFAGPGLAGTPKVAIPAFHDKYSDLVRKLEAGETDIDYLAFRESFLASRQFKVANSRSEEFLKLRDRFPELVRKSDYAGIIRTAKQMLSIDYTSMLAHKMLRQTYKILKDEANENKHRAIEFGLLKSIVRNGDGKSCKTAWPVVQVREEYFVLAMLGAKVRMQSVVNDHGMCDRMEVTQDDGPAVYYFDVSRVFASYDKMLGH